MKAHFDPIKEVLALCEQRLEGRLTAESAGRLEQLVRENAEARRICVEYLHQHATLHWTVGLQSDSSLQSLDGASRDNIVSPPAVFADTQTRRALSGRHWTAFAWAASIAIAAGLTWWMVHLGKRGPATAGSASEFATLVENKNTRWHPGRLPTEAGSRLPAGHLRLDQGLATIRLDNGVQVVLEAPADLELISPMVCVLHEGVVVAEVPPPVTGFVIETGTARLIDYGTEFGVSVERNGETQVQVLQGAVDVEHRGSGRTERLKAGRSAWVSSSDLTVAETTAYEPRQTALQPLPLAQPPVSILTLTTASGGGKNAYVQGEKLHPHRSDTLLLVKNTATEGFSRKAYLGFDLSGVPMHRIGEARLILTMAPTGYGYACFTGPTTFSVYGLTEQSLDNWTEIGITWANAPANRSGGAEVDVASTTRLGSFAVGEGVTSGQFSISGPAVAEFLRQDTNSIVTLIIVRDSEVVRESSTQHPRGLVHGFQSSRHPTGTPPMLRIGLVQEVAPDEG